MRGSRFLLLLLLSYSCNCSVIFEGKETESFFHLYTQCGNHNDRFVETYHHRVMARGLSQSSLSLLREVRMFVDNTTLVSLQNNQTRKYICFNPKGRLTTRSYMHVQDKKLCQFRANPTLSHHTEFESVHNSTWYISFRCKKKGTKKSLPQGRRPGSPLQKEREFMILEERRDPVSRHGYSYDERARNSELDALNVSGIPRGNT